MEIPYTLSIFIDQLSTKTAALNPGTGVFLVQKLCLPFYKPHALSNKGGNPPGTKQKAEVLGYQIWPPQAPLPRVSLQ